MNQLETNLALWAICSILLFELLCIICICRCCFNRIKPKRFYVKREEYEYLQGTDGLSSKFQSTILRPPHADELAVVGTIREQNPTTTFDSGILNYGFYHDDDDDEIRPSLPSLSPAPPSSSQHINWIELRSPPPTSNVIQTAQLLPADYEIRSYPTDDYVYTHQSPSLPRPTIIDFSHYRDEYDDNDHFKDDDDLESFRIHSLPRPEVIHSYVQRTDTSTESFPSNYPTPLPKSILKGSTSITPPIDFFPTPYSQTQHSRTSSKYDESSRTSSKYDQSPRTSVKINTDESIPIDYPISAIEKTIPNGSNISSNVPTSVPSLSVRMRFASVSKLNEIEWEVPREFQTIVYDLTDKEQPHFGSSIYISNENLNNNNSNSNDYDNDKVSNRQRSQSAVVDQRTNVSRVFIPWDHGKKFVQPIYLSNGIGQGDTTQQQAFEY